MESEDIQNLIDMFPFLKTPSTRDLAQNSLGQRNVEGTGLLGNQGPRHNHPDRMNSGASQAPFTDSRPSSDAGSTAVGTVPKDAQESGFEEFPAHIWGAGARHSVDSLRAQIGDWVAHRNAVASRGRTQHSNRRLFHGATFNSLQSLERTQHLFLSPAHLRALNLNPIGGEGELATVEGSNDRDFFSATEDFDTAANRYARGAFNEPIPNPAELELLAQELDNLKKEFAILQGDGDQILEAEQARLGDAFEGSDAEKLLLEADPLMQSYYYGYDGQSFGRYLDRVRAHIQTWHRSPETITRFNKNAFPVVLEFREDAADPRETLKGDVKGERWIQYFDLNELTAVHVPADQLPHVIAWKKSLISELESKLGQSGAGSADSAERLRNLLAAVHQLQIVTLPEAPAQKKTGGHSLEDVKDLRRGMEQMNLRLKAWKVESMGTVPQELPTGLLGNQLRRNDRPDRRPGETPEAHFEDSRPTSNTGAVLTLTSLHAMKTQGKRDQLVFGIDDNPDLHRFTIEAPFRQEARLSMPNGDILKVQALGGENIRVQRFSGNGIARSEDFDIQIGQSITADDYEELLVDGEENINFEVKKIGENFLTFRVESDELHDLEKLHVSVNGAEFADIPEESLLFFSDLDPWIELIRLRYSGATVPYKDNQTYKRLMRDLLEMKELFGLRQSWEDYLALQTRTKLTLDVLIRLSNKWMGLEDTDGRTAGGTWERPEFEDFFFKFFSGSAEDGASTVSDRVQDSDWSSLGLNLGADWSQIRQAYLTSAKRWHPDLHPNLQEAEDKFKEIQNAYDRLEKKYRPVRADPEVPPASIRYWVALARGDDVPEAVRKGRAGLKWERAILSVISIASILPSHHLLAWVPILFALAHWIPMAIVSRQRGRAPPIKAILQQFGALAGYSAPSAILTSFIHFRLPLEFSLPIVLIALAALVIAPSRHSRLDNQIFAKAETAGTATDSELVKTLLDGVTRTAIERLRGKTGKEINEFIRNDLQEKGIQFETGPFAQVGIKGSDIISDIDSVTDLDITLRAGRHAGTNAHEWLHVLQMEALLKAHIPTSLGESRAYEELFEFPAYRIGMQVALQTYNLWDLYVNAAGWLIYWAGLGPSTSDLTVLLNRLHRQIKSTMQRKSISTAKDVQGEPTPSATVSNEAAFVEWTYPVFKFRPGPEIIPLALFDRDGREMGSLTLSESLNHFRPEDFELELFEETKKGNRIYLVRTRSSDPSKKNLFVVSTDASGTLQYVGWPIQLDPEGGQNNFTVVTMPAVNDFFRKVLDHHPAETIEPFKFKSGMRLMKTLLDPEEIAEFQHRAYGNPVLRHLLGRLRQEAPGEARLTGLFHIGNPEAGGYYQPWSEAILKAQDPADSDESIYAHEITHFIHYRWLNPDAAIRAMIDRRINRDHLATLFHFIEADRFYNAQILRDLNRADGSAGTEPTTYQAEALAFIMGTLAQGKVVHERSRYRITYGDLRLLLELGLLSREDFGRAASVKAADNIPLPSDLFEHLAQGETPTPAIQSLNELKQYRSTSAMGSLIPKLQEQGWVSSAMVRQFVADNLSFFRGVESHHDAGDLFELIAFYALNTESTEHVQQLRQLLTDTLNDENQRADAIRLFFGATFDASLARALLAQTKGLAPDSLSRLVAYAESDVSSLMSQPLVENGLFTNAYHQAVARWYAISNLYRVLGNDAKANQALKEALKLESMEIYTLAGTMANSEQTPSQKLMGEGTENLAVHESNLSAQTSAANSPASAGFEIALARGKSMAEAVHAGVVWLRAERWILPTISVILVSISALGMASAPILGLAPVAYDVFFHKLPAAITAHKRGQSVLSIFSADRFRQSFILSLYGLPGLLSGYALHLPAEFAIVAILLSALFGLMMTVFHTDYDRAQFRKSLLRQGGLREIIGEVRSQAGKPILHDPDVLNNVSGMIPQDKDTEAAMNEVNHVRTALEVGEDLIHQSA